ncbi:MAG: DeoR family transcriptional regulator [Candidatus Altiarchaeota archaeon]|nr:DeoR family transcriptional regulator [Candidatus Altiarchaeota archaeon]
MVERILKWLGLRESDSQIEVTAQKTVKPKSVVKKSVKKKIVKRPVKKKSLKTKKKPVKTQGTKKDALVKYLSKRKKPASIEDVARKVGVTPMTARRYLYYLAKEKKVKKTKNGWVVK